MCDLSPEVRRERYKLLVSIGHTRGWAQRARDFTNVRFQAAMVRGRKTTVRKAKRLIKTSSVDVLSENFRSKIYIRPIRESKSKGE